ncbi:MAG: TIGR02281 family clan AA aspartic protease [Gammaproteobacteria bacterium]
MAIAWLVLATTIVVADPVKPRLIGLFQGQAIVDFDGKQLVLKAGGPAKHGIKLISTSQSEAVPEIDGTQSTYRLGTAIGSNHLQSGASGKTVQVAPDGGGMYFISGTINGYAVNFLVDTGASMVAMNKHTARRLGINYRLDGREGVTETASGMAKAYYLKLAKVTVGDISLADVDGAVIDGEQPSEVLLGGSFLGRLDMKREGRLLILQKKQ